MSHLQGTLKEKTVENLEKYVVKDVSTWYSGAVLQRHTILLFSLLFLEGADFCQEALSCCFFFSCFLFFFVLLPPGEAASPPQPDERSGQSFLGYQQRLQIHRREYKGGSYGDRGRVPEERRHKNSHSASQVQRSPRFFGDPQRKLVEF